MEIGVNYPWFDYGWDFGDAPPGWRKKTGTAPNGNGAAPKEAPPNWSNSIDDDLQYFGELKIRVVRWFILGDGLTYGSGKQAPQENPDGSWDFIPPDLSESFLDHFLELLDRFSDANKKLKSPIQLLPVFIDFHFCKRGSVAIGLNDDWIKGGRSSVVIDTERRKKFFECALQPLLDIAQSHPSVIFAWDVINEPEWVTSGWHPNRDAKGLPVQAQQMREFIEGAIERVRSAGFKATIGFCTVDTIKSTKLFADYNQFHHYPTCKDKTLVKNTFVWKEPRIIGEFASSIQSWNAWPELGGKDTVYNRLKLIETQEYPWTLLWSYRAHDCNTSWGEAEMAIEKLYNLH